MELLERHDLELSKGFANGKVSVETIACLKKLYYNEATHSTHAPIHFNLSLLERRTGYGKIPREKRDRMCPDPRHLLRLIFPRDHTPYECCFEGDKKINPEERSNEFCFNAGREYIAFMNLDEEEIREEIFEIPDYVLREGDEHRAFWTLYPYMLLHKQGNPGERTLGILKILQFDEERYNKFLISSLKHHEVLGFDDRMPSHLLARIHAAQIMQADS